MAEKEVRKKVGERFTIAVDFTPLLPANVAISSGIVHATRKGKMAETTLVSSVNAGASTVTLADDVKAGAAIVLDIGTVQEEPLIVGSIAGTGPYVATLVSPVQLSHSAAGSVRYEQGASSLVLANSIATVSGATLGANIIGGLVYLYILSFFATLSNGQVIRDDVTLAVQD